MKGSHCVVLQTEGSASLFALVESALSGRSKPGLVTLEDLRDLHPVSGAEMGVLIVHIRADTDVSAIRSSIAHLRGENSYLGVLALCESCEVAGELELGETFSDILSAQWKSAGEKIRRFLDIHALRIENRAFKSFLETAVDGYWIWDLEKNVVEWSERTREMTGLRPEERPNSIETFVELINPQDRDRVQQAIDNHFNHGSPYKNIEMRLRTGTGSYGDFRANGQALRDETGRPIILVGSLTDRTLLQRVEQQLEDTQKRFTVLFHHMNDAAVLADIETGMVVEANQPAERLWGRSISELVGIHQSQLHPPVLSDEAKKAFADHIAALIQNKRDTIHVPIMHKSGTEVPAEISSSLVEIGGKMMILGVFRDITERVKTAQELRERDAQIQLSSHLASMGTLAAGVAHEINNPLTYVLGNLELIKVMLEGRNDVPREVSEALDAASTGGRYVREIVSDLKAISRMDAAEGRCDPSEVIRIASRMAMSDLRHKATLRINMERVPEVPISSARLSQVVLNILSNAARSFETDDRQANLITIDSVLFGDVIKLSISDNGSGIAAEDLRRVWEPFFTKSSGSGGTGLGLSICRRLLHEAHGSLEIESELGRGTTVYITLPIVKSAGAAKSEPAIDLEPADRRKILLVDDDVLVTNLIQQVLKRDYDVTVFNDSTKAYDALAGGATFDLILCDLMMPQMDGCMFYRQVTKLMGKTPNILFVTGGAVTGSNIELERVMAGAGRLVHKPFESAELRRRILECLAKPEAAPMPKDLNAQCGLTSKKTDAVADPAVIAELEELFGKDGLRDQLGQLLDQISGFREAAVAILERDDTAEFAAQAHKLAGGADVLGLRGLGQALRKCQVTAQGGDLAEVKSAYGVVEAEMDMATSFIGVY